jgi:hypothetical protein
MFRGHLMVSGGTFVGIDLANALLRFEIPTCQIRNARYNLDGTGNRLSDGGGMYLQLDKSGGKYWRMNYRFVGKQKTLALGTYPAVSLAAARKKRENAREKLAAGIDPGEAKKAEKRAVRIAAANSFEVVANGWMEERKTVRNPTVNLAN